MGNGKINGFFSLEEFWEAHGILQKDFPFFISKKLALNFSKTIYSFAMGYNMDQVQLILDQFQQVSLQVMTFTEAKKFKAKKNVIFFSGGHHARDLISLSMMLNLLGQNLLLLKSAFEGYNSTNLFYNNV